MQNAMQLQLIPSFSINASLLRLCFFSFALAWQFSVTTLYRSSSYIRSERCRDESKTTNNHFARQRNTQSQSRTHHDIAKTARIIATILNAFIEIKNAINNKKRRKKKEKWWHHGTHHNSIWVDHTLCVRWTSIDERICAIVKWWSAHNCIHGRFWAALNDERDCCCCTTWTLLRAIGLLACIVRCYGYSRRTELFRSNRKWLIPYVIKISSVCCVNVSVSTSARHSNVCACAHLSRCLLLSYCLSLSRWWYCYVCKFVTKSTRIAYVIYNVQRLACILDMVCASRTNAKSYHSPPPCEWNLSAWCVCCT